MASAPPPPPGVPDPLGSVPIPPWRQNPARPGRPAPPPAGPPPLGPKRELPPPPKVSSYYPGSITYLDLMARNRRSSVVLIAIMILLFMAVAIIITASFFLHNTRMLLPSLLLGGGVALVVGLLTSLWAYYGGASAILALSGAKEVQPKDDPELFNVVDEVRLAAGLPMPRVFIIHDTALNAFATGRDPQHAAVAITKGLREHLDRDELQGVMAHEVAHIRHYDIRFSLLMATLAGLIAFVCDGFLRVAWAIFRSSGSGNGKEKGATVAIGGIILIIAFVLYILAPISAFFVQMAYSRQREYLADAGAVELTRNPEGLIRALMKLAGDRDPLVDVANRGTAHMYIVNPLRSMRMSGNERSSLLSSHPPLHARIERLQALMR